MIKQDYKSSRQPTTSHPMKQLGLLRHHWMKVIAICLSVGLPIFIVIVVLQNLPNKATLPQSSPVASKPVASKVVATKTNVSQVESSKKQAKPSKKTASTKSPSKKELKQSQAVMLPLKLEWNSQGQTLEDFEENKTEATDLTEIRINSGDTLSTLLVKQGLTAKDVHYIMQDKQSHDYFRNLKPGKLLILERSKSDQNLLALRYKINANEELIVEKTDDGYQSRIHVETIDSELAFASGVIDSSLFLSGKKSGLSDDLIMNLANIFGWDIDFALDIRKNDSFSLLYEKKYLKGEFIGNGRIVAARFTNQGEDFQAIYYVDKNNRGSYFSPDGKSMRKAFLRAPVNFKYISSGFNPVRFHPVLKRIRPHRGIDYVAPVGTPIRASGDGKVIISSYTKYNGKYIVIQHGNNIQTKYLHLSKRMVSKGKRVKQGDIIGKLGGTGMVTGPHLHYEFLVNGVHRNPRTVKLPHASPIDKSELVAFKKHITPIIAQLQTHEKFIADSSEKLPNISSIEAETKTKDEEKASHSKATSAPLLKQ